MKTTKNLNGKCIESYNKNRGGLVIQKSVTTVYIVKTGSGYRVEKTMVNGLSDNVETESFHTLSAAKECYYLFTGTKLGEYGFSH